jgi:hypothetical protein
MVRAVFALAGAQIGWLVLAIVLHVSGQVSRGVAWRGVLAVSWPQVTRRRACAWYVCGAGLSGLLSARGGDAIRVTLAKRELKDATWPALAGTLCAEGSFETVSGVALMLVAVSLGVGSLHAPPSALIVALALGCAIVALLAGRSGRVRCVVREVGRGAAILGSPRRWARQVLPYQVAARVLRLGAAACFLLAFGLPAVPAVVIVACLAQGSGAAVPLPGAGPAAVGAALLVGVPLAAGHAVDSTAVASLAVVWPAALTAVGVALSLLVLARLCRVRTPRALIRAARALRPHPAPAAPLI